MTFLSLIQAIKPWAKDIFKILLKAAKSGNKTLKIDEKNIEDALELHQTKINTFTSEISFKELNRPKSLFSIYIPLDLSLNLVENIEKERKNNLPEEINNNASRVIEQTFKTTPNNIILVGVPGSGKTTTLKFICQKLFTDEAYLKDIVTFPILVRLREDEVLNNRSIPLFEYILNTLGIIIENTVKCSDPIDDKNQLDLFKKQAAIKILDQLRPLLVLDGIDEVSDDNIKSKLLKNINEISLSSKNVRFILTTRKGDDIFHIDNTQVFELAPLSEDQIKKFAEKWLGPTKSKEFLEQLNSSSVFDTAKRPLTLSHLCAIFEKEGGIPDKSRSIYRKIVNLLILEWNLENQINRVSRFKSFEPDRKKEFLENFSFELSVNFNKTQFNTDDLKKCYGNLYVKFGFEFMQMQDVINEIQVHNGLIIQTGYDRFEFAHKSFQEYLAAEHIVKLPKIPVNYNLFRVPAEMALAVTLSSEPSDYFTYFVEEYLLINLCDFTFLQSFVTRIIIEKPDFQESHALAKSLLLLQNKYLEEILLNESNINSSAIEITALNNIFEMIASFENILTSFDYLRHNYTGIFQKKGIQHLEITYHMSDINNKSLNRVFVTEYFYDRFIKNILYQPLIRN